MTGSAFQRVALLATVVGLLVLAAFATASSDKSGSAPGNSGNTPGPPPFCCEDRSVVYSNGKYGCKFVDSLPHASDAAACVRGGANPEFARVKHECKPCPTCCPVGSTCGDPHVTGFDGSSYLLYGKPNTTYSLLSECNHQVNIRLYQPPSLADGHALYIQAVGIIFRTARISVQLVPADGPTPAAMLVTVNGGEPFGYPGQPAERAIDVHTAFAFESAHRITVHSTSISFNVRLMDGDHLDVGVEEVATNWQDVHGVMGQSYATAFGIKYNYQRAEAVGIHPGNNARIKAQLKLQGGEDDYIVSSLFASDHKFNRFCISPKGELARQQFEQVSGASRKMLQQHADTAGAVAEPRLVVPSQAGVSMSGVVAGVAQLAPQRLLLQTTYFTCQPTSD